jgi:hypothetical protein
LYYYPLIEDPQSRILHPSTLNAYNSEFYVSHNSGIQELRLLAEKLESLINNVLRGFF